MTAEAETKEFSADIKELGDKIAGMTLLQAKDLADYLKDVHGIEAIADKRRNHDIGPKLVQHGFIEHVMRNRMAGHTVGIELARQGDHVVCGQS